VFDALHRSSPSSSKRSKVYRSRRSPCAGDLRPRPLGELKARLANVLGGKPGGILFNEHTDEDGAVTALGLSSLT
jgi:hypothetical protein